MSAVIMKQELSLARFAGDVKTKSRTSPACLTAHKSTVGSSSTLSD